MTDREQQMIEAYIPSPRDETLGFGEYYYLQTTSTGDRVIRVTVHDILPHEDGTEYGIYQGHRRIDAGYDDWSRGVRMHDLYDNREDCKNFTHMMYDGWEHLRELQRREATE